MVWLWSVIDDSSMKITRLSYKTDLILPAAFCVPSFVLYMEKDIPAGGYLNRLKTTFLRHVWNRWFENVI